MGELGRRPITIVEIDLPYCSLTYGTGDCAAVLGTTGAAKCFNARKACQDSDNYAATTKTVSYVTNQDGIPDIPGIYPALKSVSTRPAEINLSGINPRSTALGVRARVTVVLEDFADADTWLDKYQSERVTGTALASGIGYQPKDRGTHLRRLMARFPYYVGLSARVRRGYEGDAPGDMPTEYYVISEIDGPGAGGQMSLVLKDVLDLVENEKAVYPRQSTGKLLAEITADTTEATLTPEGIGDDEYEATGLVRIGREIMEFTRAGDDLTLTRAQEGTTASSHNVLDVVQVCGVLVSQPINEAAETILKSNTTDFDTLIDTAEWATANDDWYAGIKIGRVIISKPEGKNKLIGELCQLGVLIWPDILANALRYRVNAPLEAGEVPYPVSDESGIIEGTPGITRAEDQRISTLIMYHGIIDWTASASSVENYAKASVAAVLPNLYGQDAIKEIPMRWFGRTGDDSTASVIVERMLSRYTITPNVISGALDVKDRASITLGDRIEVTSYVLQDDDGGGYTEQMQVNYIEYADDLLKFRAETFSMAGRFGYYMDSDTDEMDYDTATAAERAEGAYYWDNTDPDFLSAAFIYY
jgi:hypothetical protein